MSWIRKVLVVAKVAVKVAGKVAKIKELPIIESIIDLIDDAVEGRPITINQASSKNPSEYHFPAEND